jgi:acetyltransferase-like isoleucine patch superfamily enzyme
MGLNVVDARLITSANGFSLETYVVLEDNGAVIADAARIREIERGLWRALQQARGFAAHRDAARAAPGAHVLDADPGQLQPRHAQQPHHPRTDRGRPPGLLSEVGKVFKAERVAINGAKIMTVGERAEDVFYITDMDGWVLPEEACQRVQDALVRALDRRESGRGVSAYTANCARSSRAPTRSGRELSPPTRMPRASCARRRDLIDACSMPAAARRREARRRWHVNRMAQEGGAAVLSHRENAPRAPAPCASTTRCRSSTRLGRGAIRGGRRARGAARHGAARRLRRPNAVLMPSYVNIGAYVDSGTMVDTWATVGSCAQIGKNVHLSGGVGIGGVLEPLQANPTIIEDNCFIGARSEIVEGVIVETGAVISMGVFIGQSTRIYDRERDEILYGRVPAGAVVVPGSLPAKPTASTASPAR